MESDNKYFLEGLFIIGLSIAVAFFFVWLQSSGHRDDVLYRIHFTDSVSGLALGDPVKFHGVDIGTVKTIALDAADPRKVQVEVRLRQDAPVKADTRAVLKLKGITGVVFVELSGGAPNSPRLAAVTPEGQVPEIVSEKGSLNAILDSLPRILEKFSSIEDQTKKVVTDVGEVTGKLKNNPLVGFGSPKEKDSSEGAQEGSAAEKRKAPRTR
jgi:phospholipid/cholesterol/gamma-HCH transport system substrate-binding protein